MKKLKAFTLIEILVAMLVGSFVILMATELISYQGKSRSQHNDKQQMLAFEIALKILRGDINTAMKSANGRKNVVWSSDNNSSVTFSLVLSSFNFVIVYRSIISDIGIFIKHLLFIIQRLKGRKSAL